MGKSLRKYHIVCYGGPRQLSTLPMDYKSAVACCPNMLRLHVCGLSAMGLPSYFTMCSTSVCVCVFVRACVRVCVCLSAF